MSARLVVVVGSAALLLLAGCQNEMGAARLTYDDTETTKITEIVLTGGSGNVTIATSSAPSAPATRIRRIVRTSGADPEVSYRVDKGVLSIDTDCGAGCQATYEITAPAGVAVRGQLSSGNIQLAQVGSANVRTGSGDIELTRIDGTVKAEATSGSIEANATGGALTLRTTSGDITGASLRGGKAVAAEATSGNVEIGLAEAASVNARVQSGNIELTVPPGPYRVLSSLDNGDLDSDVVSSPGATSVLDVSATSGNASIELVES